LPCIRDNVVHVSVVVDGNGLVHAIVLMRVTVLAEVAMDA
jgi:hypothetical protein